MADVVCPPSLDFQIYQDANPDLAGFSHERLAEHWNAFGRYEGRRSSKVESREDLAALIPPEHRVLEIGPFSLPVLRGPNVAYFDVLDREGLQRRAVECGLDPEGVPAIDWVSPVGDLGVVRDSFDVVLSSHAIEHQPDLVAHLRQVSDLLRPQGCYFLIIADSRYCFDHFIAPSTIAGVLDAHRNQRRRHTDASVLEHRALTTHNDPGRHWSGDHGDPRADRDARLARALKELDAADDTYIDVHAWQFTPESFASIIEDLERLSLTSFSVAEVYPTLRNTLEFRAILRKE